MSVSRETVLEKHTFAREALEVFTVAERIAMNLFEDEVFCVHVFVACVYRHPDILHKLLGREITQLPKKYDFGPDDLCGATRKSGRKTGAKGKKRSGEEDGDSLQYLLFPEEGADADPDDDAPDFADELALVFMDDTPGSTLQTFRNYAVTDQIGVAEIALSVLTAPAEEIADILLKNGFPNNARLLGDLLRENYLRHICDFIVGPPRERLKNAVHIANRFKERMEASLFGQKKAIDDVASHLTDFWFRGNNGKPLTILLLGKPGGGRSCFARSMQQAFVDLGLQDRVESPVDMSGFIHEQACEPDLLGDAKSYRNARPGLLYNRSKGNHRGVMVFEDVLDGCRVAANVLRSFASNLAFDKYHEEPLLIPYNVLVLTVRITEDQYKYLQENRTGGINARLLNRLFQSGEEDDFSTEMSGYNSTGLWQCVDRTVVLEDLSDSETRALAGSRLDEIECRLEKDYGIVLRCGDRDRFIAMLLLSALDDRSPGELVGKMDDAFRELWKKLNGVPDIRAVELVCPELPEYRYDPGRRVIRGDYLDFTKTILVKGDTVRMAYENLRYVQMERVDCGDYRIEHPKSVRFEDIIGHDDVRDELVDALNYVTNRDKYDRKTPEACQNFILFGKPGTGKTSIATALANSADVPVFFVPNATFTNPRKLRAMFRKAEEQAPAVIVLEEINTLGNSTYGRRDAINELLSILDGPQKGSRLLIIASTNHLEQLEPALLRPGRFGRQIEIGLPDDGARKAFILKFETDYEVSIPEDARNALVAETDGCSLAELKGILGYALRTCIRKNMPLDFDTLIGSVRLFRKSPERTIGFNRGDER